jgi:hypothetical protein
MLSHEPQEQKKKNEDNTANPSLFFLLSREQERIQAKSKRSK